MKTILHMKHMNIINWHLLCFRSFFCYSHVTCQIQKLNRPVFQVMRSGFQEMTKISPSNKLVVKGSPLNASLPVMHGFYYAANTFIALMFCLRGQVFNMASKTIKFNELFRTSSSVYIINVMSALLLKFVVDKIFQLFLLMNVVPLLSAFPPLGVDASSGKYNKCFPVPSFNWDFPR